MATRKATAKPAAHERPSGDVRASGPKKIKRTTKPALTKSATALVGRRIILPETLELELDARHPYDPAGLMDFYMPGRWDSTYDLVYMDTIVTGADPGEWTGTAAYLQFTAPSDGLYLVVMHFSGVDITMRLFGPWGTTSAHTNTPSDAGAVLAAWVGGAGSTLYFEASCITSDNEYGIGYLAAVEVYLLG
jgi:hypothetical protein